MEHGFNHTATTGFSWPHTDQSMIHYFYKKDKMWTHFNTYNLNRLFNDFWVWNDEEFLIERERDDEHRANSWCQLPSSFPEQEIPWNKKS